jgi:hypothetical protein
VLLTLATLACLVGSGSVALATLEYSSLPEISLPGGIPVPASAKVGEELVCSSGSWNGRPGFVYEWYREGFKEPNNTRTPGTYLLEPADQNHKVLCVVTAIQGTESVVVESVNSVCVGTCGGGGPPEEAPQSKAPPTISGTPEVGKTLTCSQGEWSGSPPPTFTYLWLRDKETAIPGATSSSYTVKEEDATHKLSCRVTAKNGAGEAAAESTGVLIKGEAPRSVLPPKVQGTARVGSTLTCNEGTWSGSKPITFKIEWLRNRGSTGATGSAYVVQQPDEGQKLSCRVTAENLAGFAIAVSEEVTIAGEPIRATGVPKIEWAQEGETLACSKGSWSQPPVKEEYAWVRENPTNGAKETQRAATEPRYQVGNEDLGTVLYCVVTAFNSRNESASATSEGFPVPKGSGTPPEEIRPPTVTSSTESIRVGTTLTCQKGEWTNATNFAYQWLREGVAIPNETLQRHVVEAADQGTQLACIVTAENSAGATKAKSAGVKVPGEAPAIVSAPEVQGPTPPQVGDSVTCVRGVWKGAPAPTFEYEWLRLPEGKVVGTAQNYTVTAEDRGHTMTCSVTATNPLGSTQAKAKEPIAIPGSAPVPPLAGATIEGEAAVGKRVTCNPGVWGGAPPPTFTYAWMVNGSPIPGQTEASFTVLSVDRGLTLQCKVTGSNVVSSATSTSKGVHIAGVRPEPLEPPYVEGTGKVGLTLTCARGVWNGKPAPSFSYQWYRDGVSIERATESTYMIQVADVGHLLTCTVTATNPEGRVEAESINGVVVPGAGHAVEASAKERPPSTVIPSAGVILGSLRRQLTTVLEKAHLKSVLAHGFTFSFNPPTRGTLEVMWYKRYKIRGAHGSTHTRYTLLAQSGKNAYASVTKGTVRVKLTAAGKSALRGSKRVGIVVKAVFRVPGKPPVTWTGTIVLS